MGKKKLRAKYISKGVGQNVTQSTLNTIRRERNPADRQFAILNAWIKGGNPWITIANPNKNETNKRFIKVRLRDLKGGTYKDKEKSFYMV